MPKPLTPWNVLLPIVAGLILLASPLALAGYKGPPHSAPVERTEPDPRFVQYSLPPGSAFQILLETPLSTAINQLKDPVEGVMDHNLYLNEELILTKNTRFTGYISKLVPPIQGRNGILQVIFNAITTEDGEKLPIVAHVRTERTDHQWGGELTPGTKPMLSTQRVYGLGEYNRIVFGGPRAMGKAIEILPGEHWILILEQPLVLLKPKTEL